MNDKMELNRGRFGKSIRRSGFMAWVEENPRTAMYGLFIVLILFLTGVVLSFSFGYEDTADCSDSAIRLFLAKYSITTDEHFLKFYLLSLLLVCPLVYKFVSDIKYKPYSNSSLLVWAAKVAAKEKVEDNFDDYAMRVDREMFETPRKGSGVLMVAVRSLIGSLWISVPLFSYFIMPVIRYVNDVTAGDSEMVRTVITGKYAYNVKSSSYYKVKLTLGDERMALRVDGTEYEDARPGDSIVLSVRYGAAGFYNIDCYILHTGQAGKPEMKRSGEMVKAVRTEPEVTATAKRESRAIIPVVVKTNKATEVNGEEKTRMDKETVKLSQYIRKHLFDVIETTNGYVTVTFNIDNKGKISNLEMQKKLHRRVDKALFDAVDNMKEWPAVKILKLDNGATVNLHVSYVRGKPVLMECSIFPHSKALAYRMTVRY